MAPFRDFVQVDIRTCVLVFYVFSPLILLKRFLVSYGGHSLDCIWVFMFMFVLLKICKWNLQKFAEALSPALPLSESSTALEKYDSLFESYYRDGMRRFVY